MAFPFLKLLPGVLRQVAKILKLPKLEEAAQDLAEAPLTAEQQAELEAALLRHEQAMKALSVEEMRAALSEGIAMVQSDDAFVKRARPFGLYAFYTLTAAVAVAQIAGVSIDAAAIMATLGPLGGVAGTYTYRRTSEKLGNGSNGA